MPSSFPELLKAAMDLRQMSASALGRCAQIHANTVRNYLHGQTDFPSDKILEKLASGLGVEVSFFYQENLPKPRHLFFRSYSQARLSARRAAKSRARVIANVYNRLGGLVTLPQVNLPAFNWLPDDPNHLTNSDIDRAASELRQFLGIGNRPIKNLTWLLENNGIYVIEGLWYDEFIDAFSGWFNSDQEKAIIMLGKEERLPSRQRFSLAHELGHLILHKPVISDSDDERVPLKIVERHANRFASSFLLPPESFNADLERGQDLRAFLSLKPKWNVSCRAMIYCAAERGYLSDDRKATLFKLANGKWGSKSEPLEDSRFESPYQAREALKLLSSNKVMALEDWKTHCGLRVEELLDMVGCEDLLQDDSNIIEIKSLGNVRDIGIV